MGDDLPMGSIDIWQAAVLGGVEGLTEFLPVSSTGHLRIVEGLLGIDVAAQDVVAFTAVVQVGAIAAVLLYFFSDIMGLVRVLMRGLRDGDTRRTHDYRFAWWIIAATIPIVVAGLIAKPLIDGPLASLWVVVFSLVAGSALLWVADRVSTQARSQDDVTLVDSMLVGGSQILALLFPGFSRSGATMSTGMLRGLDRVAATRLSFFLSIPALAGAGLYELKDALGSETSSASLAVGTAVSFVVAYASIAWLLRYVSRHSFTTFVYYRLGVAALLATLLITGVVAG